MYNPHLHFHFVGIGGSGMSGIAEILLSLGFHVSGSNDKQSEITDRLSSLGAKVFIGHHSSHVDSTTTSVVFSSAVSQENPELQEARRRGIPVVRRAEVLAELMRLKYSVGVAGSHGKTTTTSMTAAILEAGGLDPTVIIGGKVQGTLSGGKLGKSEYLVAETDESDRSFLLLKPTIAIVTNVDDEHLTAYSSSADLDESFFQFIESVPFYGLAILCRDDPRVQELSRASKKRILTYGFSPDAELRAVPHGWKENAQHYTVLYKGKTLGPVALQMPGTHLMSNSLAAIAVGLEFGVPFEIIQQALRDFPGVSRRLELVGSHSGIRVVNDYAHHPAEILATLKALKEQWLGSSGKLTVVFQPHRYTRTRDCFEKFLDAFLDADRVLITEIYAASESPIEGISGKGLCEAVRHPLKQFFSSSDELFTDILSTVRKGDLVAFLGAGSIGEWPKRFLDSMSSAHA